MKEQEDKPLRILFIESLFDDEGESKTVITRSQLSNLCKIVRIETLREQAFFPDERQDYDVSLLEIKQELKL